MKLYHTSPSLITEIHDKGNFGSFLFFSSNVYYMSQSSDSVVYECDTEDKDVIEASQLFYHEDYEKLAGVVAHVMSVCDVDEEEAQSLLSQESRVDDAENDWWVQSQTAECARILGFVGVSMRDEQGTCYMLDVKQVKMVISNIEAA